MTVITPLNSHDEQKSMSAHAQRTALHAILRIRGYSVHLDGTVKKRGKYCFFSYNSLPQLYCAF